MNSIKIIHTADCHLGSGRSHVENGKSELKNTFFRILGLCHENSVDFLLIAGDLFDSPFVDRETVREVASAMRDIPDTSIIITSGNHDCACAGSVYDTFTFPENVHLFTSGIDYIDFPEKSTRIYGAGFASSHCPHTLLDSFSITDADKINIGVFHGEIATSSLYNPISVEQVAASGLDYMALGHIHKRSEILKSGNTFYSYCGCVDGRGFDECGSMGVYMGTIGKYECRLEYIELSSRLYISDNINISGCSSSQNAATTILEYVKNIYDSNFSENLYKLTLTGCVDPDIILNTQLLQNTLSKHVKYCEITDCTEPEIADLEALSKEPTLRGIFTRKMLNRLEAASPDNRHIILDALKIGLRAFEREVKLLDN